MVHPLHHFPGQIRSHFVPLTQQRLNTACRTHSCPPSTNSWSLPKNAISKTFEFNLAVWYFNGKGDDVTYHLDDCCLVSRSSKYPVFISCNNFALEVAILHWLFKQSTCNCSSILFVRKQLQKKLCKDQSHPQLPMLIHTRYPLHIQP